MLAEIIGELFQGEKLQHTTIRRENGVEINLSATAEKLIISRLDGRVDLELSDPECINKAIKFINGDVKEIIWILADADDDTHAFSILKTDLEEKVNKAIKDKIISKKGKIINYQEFEKFINLDDLPIIEEIWDFNEQGDFVRVYDDEDETAEDLINAVK